jgi:uncharacterized MnhB-related membrane protein
MILEIMVLAVIGLSVAVVESKDLLHAIIIMAASDMVLAGVFYLMAAPDIAITQAAVVAGLSTLIMVIAINKTHRKEGVEE